MIAYVFQKYPKYFCNLPVKFVIFLKSNFLTVSVVFSVYKQRLDKLKTRTATNSKISVFVICVKAIIYLLFMTVFIIAPLN